MHSTLLYSLPISAEYWIVSLHLFPFHHPHSFYFSATFNPLPQPSLFFPSILFYLSSYSIFLTSSLVSIFYFSPNIIISFSLVSSQSSFSLPASFSITFHHLSASSSTPLSASPSLSFPIVICSLPASSSLPYIIP